jgi:membrane associated rhomboid family serine protease
LSYAWVTEIFAVWQLVTYMFLHNPGDFQHILWNMLGLWMFGKDLEVMWGTRRFLQYYFLCGIGAGICVLLASALFGSPASRTIGSSGAVYGLLLAFGVLFPDAQIIFLIFPIKAKYAVIITGAITFMLTFGATGDGVSHVAHLGGMAIGFLYLKSKYAKRVDLLSPIVRWYTAWKQARAKRKFEVYMNKKRDSKPGRDRMIH